MDSPDRKKEGKQDNASVAMERFRARERITVETALRNIDLVIAMYMAHDAPSRYERSARYCKIADDLRRMIGTQVQDFDDDEDGVEPGWAGPIRAQRAVIRPGRRIAFGGDTGDLMREMIGAMQGLVKPQSASHISQRAMNEVNELTALLSLPDPAQTRVTLRIDQLTARINARAKEEDDGVVPADVLRGREADLDGQGEGDDLGRQQPDRPREEGDRRAGDEGD